jgi:hypothetical protein
MADGIKSIIEQLEHQKAAIERALEALQEIEGMGSGTSASAPVPTKRRGRPAKKTGGVTPEGRERLAEAMKQRWAAKRTPVQAKKSPGRPKKAA